MQMSDETGLPKRISMHQQETLSNKCGTTKKTHELATTNLTKQDAEKIRDDVKSDRSFAARNKSNCNHFIHEPEELFALYDSRLHFQINSSPTFDNKMATPSNTMQFINDKVFNLTVKDNLQLATTKEDDVFLERKQSLQSLDDLESELSKNKYCTDADVLRAVCVFSESPVNRSASAFERNVSPQLAKLSLAEKVSNMLIQQSDSNSVHSLEYWSDEEGCYPPQMSLSPLPGETKVRKPTLTESKKYNKQERTMKANQEIKEPIKSANDLLSRTNLKRPLVRTLNPIPSKNPSYHSHSQGYQTAPNVNKSASQNIMPSFFINSTESVAKSMTSSQLYNWTPRPPNDVSISSPSLIRATIATPPRTRKFKQSTEIFPLSYSNRIKEDKLFDTQRCSMPKRKVSRSQSNNTTLSSSKLFPEISSISKNQIAGSKSISDFRQSSSIFGKLVKKNTLKGTTDDKSRKCDKSSKVTDSTSSGSSRSKVGETTRRKLRRILSLH